MTQHCRIRFLRLLSERSGVRVPLAQTSLRNTSKTLRGSQHNSRAVAQLARALTLPFPTLICVILQGHSLMAERLILSQLVSVRIGVSPPRVACLLWVITTDRGSSDADCSSVFEIRHSGALPESGIAENGYFDLQNRLTQTSNPGLPVTRFRFSSALTMCGSRMGRTSWSVVNKTDDTPKYKASGVRRNMKKLDSISSPHNK